VQRTGTWLDPDRRRAAALSLLVHAVLGLSLVTWIDMERPSDPMQESFLVIDIGTPSEVTASTPAAADEVAAPEAPRPVVRGDLPGRPTPGLANSSEATAGDPARPEPTAAELPPMSEISAAVNPERVPTPTARAPTSAAPAPAPQVSATVPEIDSPELDLRPLPDRLPIPQVSSRPVSGAIALPSAAPEVRAEARPLAPPSVRTSDETARTLDAPSPVASNPDTRSLTAPAVEARAAGPARDLDVTPSTGVRALRRLPAPVVQAVIRATPPDVRPGGAANVPESGALAGGDAPRPGQPEGPVDAPADALGSTRVPGQADAGPGAAVPPAPPLRETRPRPLAVILDNALGYPQEGLPQASWIAEMPVEGGVTRLLAFFDTAEPVRVGPVRSARDYMVEVAARADAVLVHDGGSPSAMIALDQGVVPSLNAYRRGDLFDRAADRSAPYNLYSAGPALRAAIRRMPVDANRLLSGFRPVTPGEEAVVASEVTIEWSGAYDSGFRYLPAQDRYRWVRGGRDGVSASGTAVQVDAVLIAEVTARPVPGDNEGRLFIPVNGGSAKLLWRGRVQEGSWSVDGGLRFTDLSGRRVSLEALVTWAAFVPQSATVEVR